MMDYFRATFIKRLKKGAKIAKYKKELKAILLGLATSYIVQVITFIIAYCIHINLTTAYLIPNIGIILPMTPVCTWLWLAFLRVSWFDNWCRITTYILYFVAIFLLIFAVPLCTGIMKEWMNSTALLGVYVTIPAIVTMTIIYMKKKD